MMLREVYENPPWYVPLFTPDANAFNPEFINAVGVGSLVLVAAVAAVQTVKIVFSSTAAIEGSEKPTTFPHAVKLFLTIVQLILVSTLSFVTYGQSQTSSLLLNAVVLVGLILPLQLLEERRSRVPLASVLLFWVANIFLVLVSVIQDSVSVHTIVASNKSLLVLEWVTLFNAVPIFVLEFGYYTPLVDFPESDGLHVDLISYFTTSWFSPITKHIYETESLELSDLPKVAGGLYSESSFPVLEKNWTNRVKKASAAKPRKPWILFGKPQEVKPSLLFAVASSASGNIFLAFILDIVSIAFRFVSPYFLRQFILFFTASLESPGSVPIIYGYGISFALFALKISGTLLTAQVGIVNNKVLYFLDSALSKLVFVKALKLSPQARRDKPTGEIINHATSDKETVIALSTTMGELIVLPVQVLLNIWLLHNLLGNSIWGGFVAGLTLIPATSYLSSLTTPVYMRMLKNKDERVSLINELLVNIKTIKLHSWEDPISKKVKAIRDGKELANLSKIGVIMSFGMFLFLNIPFLIMATSFAIFAHWNSVPLTPDIVFPSVVYLGYLTESTQRLPKIIQDFIQSRVALNRLRDYFLSDELNLDNSRYYKRHELSENTNAVAISNATFVWSADNSKPSYKDEEEQVEESSIDKNVALSEINFNAKVGDLTCIVGKVGSGKTTLLKSILGEIPIAESEYSDAVPSSSLPSVDVFGTIAYCPQSPWILNASVKENILFGFKYEKEFYNKTVEACELVADFKVLPDGDKTIVGEKGISLSGGQKVRVALARAVYSRADIFLFDDILSAVDAHVGKKIASNVLGRNGILGSRTKILATNSINVLHHADQIVLLKSGSIAETGDYNTVVSRKSDLAHLLEEYGRQNVESNQDDDSSSEEKFLPQSLRRASVVSYDHQYDLDSEDEETSDSNEPSPKKKTGHTKEETTKGSLKFSLVLDYLKACNLKIVVLYLLLTSSVTLAEIAKSYILAIWSELNLNLGKTTDTFLYLGAFGIIGLVEAFVSFVGYYIIWKFSVVSGGSAYHARLLDAVLRSPMSFFDTTPVGRILNRFTDDILILDLGLPLALINIFGAVIPALGSLVTVTVNIPYMAFVILVLVFIFNSYRKEYIPAKKEFQRLWRTSRSPILSSFQESIAGVDTIKAFDQEGRFTYRLVGTIDNFILISFLKQFSARWLNIRLQFISANFVLFTTAFATTTLLTSNPLSPGIISFLVLQALGITDNLSGIIDYWADLESRSVALERLDEYFSLPSEAPLVVESNRPPKSWPETGVLTFKDYSTKYRENLDPVLKNINASIKASEKVGVVGRTGAGKSSLTLAIFRIIEPITGAIDIDGIDTSKIGLRDLRTKLNIIPQESQLIRGSIRENLDPFGKHSDEELWKVLDLSHLKEHIKQMTTKPTAAEIKKSKNPDQLPTLTGLDAKVDDSGSNLSAGQKQLLSLSRALLNSEAKILVLDEATSSVDVETDKIVQTTIRKEFRDKTILTIAHRLETILDSDRVLVLDKGEIKEFDSPDILLKDEKSIFYSLCKEGGFLS